MRGGGLSWSRRGCLTWEGGANHSWKWPMAGGRKQAVVPAVPTCGPSPSLQGVSASSQVILPGHLCFSLASGKSVEHQTLTSIAPRFYGELCKTPAVAVWPSRLWGLHARRPPHLPHAGRGGSRAWQAWAARRGAWKSLWDWWGLGALESVSWKCQLLPFPSLPSLTGHSLTLPSGP